MDVVDNLPSTDHFAVEFHLLVSIPTQTQCRRSLYNYKKADFDTFREVLFRVPWTCVSDCNDIEYSWSLWKDLFFAAVNECVPRVQWKRRKMKHWFSSNTISFIHKKRQLYLLKKSRPDSTAVAIRYRKISNIVRYLTRYDTKHHTLNICSDYAKNPKRFWSWAKASKGYRDPIPTLNYNGSIVSEDTAKATCFNNYFSSVFTDEDTSSLSDLRSTVVWGSDLINTVDFTPNVVLKVLTSLNVSKACGPDLIPARLLKEGATSICASLAHLFQLSLDSGTLPSDWTTANVVPVFKRNDRHQPSNYRPISLTSLVVKVMEKIVHCQIMEALESHKLISSFQFGFRCGHSTVDLLLRTIHDMAISLEKRSSVHCLLLDFSKAFDSVPHQRLLLKLEAIGIRGYLLQWIRSFLTNRLQRVVINGRYSPWLPVKSGVPQGSILGPLLFILYVNDIYSVIHHSKHGMFADDLSIYTEVSTTADCVLLQHDLDGIVQWSKQWQLQLNCSKCEALNVSNKRSPLLYTYTISSQPIQWSSQCRYLGVLIDSHLRWKAHCRNIVHKGSRILNLLRRSLFGCTKDVKSIAYKVIVRPCLEYASVVWNPHTVSDIDIIEAVQKRAARWICASWNPSTFAWNKSYADCLCELNWPTLAHRRHYYIIDYIHSMLHKRTSLSFDDYFKLNSSSTRSHELSIQPVISTINSFRYSFFVNSVFLWNSVPFSILSTVSKYIFRCKLRSFLS